MSPSLLLMIDQDTESLYSVFIGCSTNIRIISEITRHADRIKELADLATQGLYIGSGL